MPTHRARLVSCGVVAVTIPADNALGISVVDGRRLSASIAWECGRTRLAHLADARAFAVGEAKHAALTAAGAERDDHFRASHGLQFRQQPEHSHRQSYAAAGQGIRVLFDVFL